MSNALGLLGPVIGNRLADAQSLLKNLDLEHTGYNHCEINVVWSGTCESHTDCSGFIANGLL